MPERDQHRVLVDSLSEPVTARPLAKASAPNSSQELDVREVRARAAAMTREFEQQSSQESDRLARAQDASEFRAAFKAARMSKRAFARRCGVSHTFIADILNGHSDVTPRVLRNMPAAAKVRWGDGFLKSAEEEDPPSAAGWR